MRTTLKKLLSFVLFSNFILVQAASATGNPAKGKQVFAKCMACHTIEEEKNRVGPHLMNILNRKAAKIEGFKYSQSMIKAGENGMIWDTETLTSYLAAPKQLIPGNKMSFPGLKNPTDIQDLIAYIRTITIE